MGLNKSLSIILNLYKKGKIGEEDTIHLIEDLYNKPTQYYYNYPWLTTTTYSSSNPDNADNVTYTITC